MGLKPVFSVQIDLVNAAGSLIESVGYRRVGLSTIRWPEKRSYFGLTGRPEKLRAAMSDVEKGCTLIHRICRIKKAERSLCLFL